MKNYWSCIFIFLAIAGYFQNNVMAGELKGKIKMDGEPLSNVVVSLEPTEKIVLPMPDKIAVMDQVALTFVPHVLPVLIGTKVIFPNSDKIRHSVFSNSPAKKFDFGTYAPGTEKFIICDKLGVISLICYIHHDMSAHIVVLNTPYFTVSDKEGEYKITNVPAGNYTVVFWHEEVKIKSEKISIPAKGTLTKNIAVEF